MKVCEICGKGTSAGNNVSHSMRHTKRTFEDKKQKVDVELNGKKGKKYVEAAKKVGEIVAKRALEAGITTVVFDRGGFLFHGRVKALADAAREAGLKF